MSAQARLIVLLGIALLVVSSSAASTRKCQGKVITVECRIGTCFKYCSGDAGPMCLLTTNDGGCAKTCVRNGECRKVACNGCIGDCISPPSSLMVDN